MSVKVLADGTIASLFSKVSGEKLSAPGNHIRGLLVKEDFEDKWISNIGISKVCEIIKGALFDKVTSKGYMEDIRYQMEIRLPHGSSTNIEFDLELEFSNHEIGDFWHDESKMCICWELEQKKPEIIIDEPFGVVTCKPNRPIHAANYVALFENDKGVVVRHNGTPKSWVTGNKVTNLIAWGGKRFTNRSGFLHEATPRIDVRLDGVYHYNYSISIAEHKDIPRITSDINSRITPFWIYEQKESTNILPFENKLIEIESNNIIPTAVEENDGNFILRAYEVSGTSCIPVISTAMNFIEKTDVAGKLLNEKEIRPYEIVELKYRLVDNKDY